MPSTLLTLLTLLSDDLPTATHTQPTQVSVIAETAGENSS